MGQFSLLGQIFPRQMIVNISDLLHALYVLYNFNLYSLYAFISVIFVYLCVLFVRLMCGENMTFNISFAHRTLCKS